MAVQATLIRSLTSRLGGTGEELLLEPHPYQPVPQAEPQDTLGEMEAAPPQEMEEHPPQTWRRVQREQPWLVADSTVLPLQAVGPLTKAGDQQMQYWPFATSDLYNWKLQTAKFSEKPQGLIDLLESVLQVLFTTEERDRILVEARKLVPGVDGNPTTNQALIDEAFPLVRPNWDFNVAEGKERLQVYPQTVGGLQVATRHPTNLAKIRVCSKGEQNHPQHS
ncbi:uncharacterized protein LOC115072873 isoform X2 [Nannospalax galili]|uniref:uncharacterized protein LOC115072873 isoform X2 n=1 Tax=Nannospalax galili TaxID=1026970 RepID=UPI00111BF197|nr:uncharacterized protein LOC115072873 isoform X2 [Nannospalax galili]XP_029426725.1 uncharacterized protein LOC115072873 isoform X2 [Nannospalax galili]